jgi:hypothetical protein
MTEAAANAENAANATDSDWPELPFPDADEPVVSFSGPAEATATITVATNGTGYADGTGYANGSQAAQAATEPASGSPSPAAATTLNGLPVRRPKAQLPPKARRTPAPGPAPAASSDHAPAPAPPDEPGCHPEPVVKKARIDRDPEHVAATMAAYARGLTGRSGPKQQ